MLRTCSLRTPSTEPLLGQVFEIYFFSFWRVNYFLILVWTGEIFLISRFDEIFFTLRFDKIFDFISRFDKWNIFYFSFWQVKYFLLSFWRVNKKSARLDEIYYLVQTSTLFVYSYKRGKN